MLEVMGSNCTGISSSFLHVDPYPFYGYVCSKGIIWFIYPGGGEGSHTNRGGNAHGTSYGSKSWVLVPLRVFKVKYLHYFA